MVKRDFSHLLLWAILWNVPRIMVRGTKRGAAKTRNITDIEAVLLQHMPKGWSKTKWAEEAGVASAFREFGRNPDKSMSLQTLDKLAQAAGKDDFVHLVGRRPRFDRELLRKAVREVIDARDHAHPDLAPAQCANLVVALLDHFTRQSGPQDPAALRDRLEFALALEEEKAADGA